jgi:hypothetical protein
MLPPLIANISHVPEILKADTSSVIRSEEGEVKKS